ncbi:MAG: hypothetical protein ABW104_03275 [Candidatus Thiodiazotropha sp. 6PLUC2]
MSPWKTFFNTLTILLLILIGITTALLYFQWFNPPQAQSTVENGTGSSADTEKNASISPFTPVPLNIYSEITERPLFREGRLPPEEPDEPAKSPIVRQAPLKLRLEGVVITPKNRVAVIRDLNNNRLLRVAQGMNQNDWKLETVDTASATVVRRGKKIKLELQIEKDVKGVPPRMKLPFRPKR